MIELKNVTLAYGDQVVLKDQNLSAAPGAHIAIMGPSGCGKTSLLRLMAGLTKPTAGSVSVRATRVSCLFQEPRLFPWLTAEENVNTVLSDRPYSLPEAREWLNAVGLEYAAKKYSTELSGGMQQRVSLARALAYGGDILLLDEPLKGLDTDTKADMIRLIQEHTAGKTVLLATHDKDEALALADIFCIYRSGCFTR